MSFAGAPQGAPDFLFWMRSMMMRKYLIPCLAFALQCLTTHAAVPDPASDAMPIAAQYREISPVGDGKPRSSDWYLVRRAGEVDIVRGDYAEVWKRDERGEIDLTRVFHDDRKLVAYSGGELRTQRRYPEGSALNTLFDPRHVATLKPDGKLTWLGRSATRYKGTLAGKKAEVVWLDKESLVAKLLRSNARGRTGVELKALHATPDAAWPRTGLDGTDDYALIDGADFGDMEYDPFVQRVTARDGMHGGAGGHAHSH